VFQDNKISEIMTTQLHLKEKQLVHQSQCKI